MNSTAKETPQVTLTELVWWPNMCQLVCDFLMRVEYCVLRKEFNENLPSWSLTS